MAKHFLRNSLFGNLAKRAERAAADTARAEAQAAMGAAGSSRSQFPAWMQAFKHATPVERQGLNLLARALGGSRLGVLDALFNLIPGLKSQRVDAPNTSAPSVREVLKRNPLPGVGPRGEDTRLRPDGGSSYRPSKPATGPPRAGGGTKPSTGGGGFTRPPVGPAQGAGGSDEDLPFGEIIEDEEIGFGTIVPRPPKRAGKDGAWEHFPGLNRIPPPDPQERARRKEAGVAGSFGSVDMFEPKAPSSNVHQVGYDPDERTLYVRFYPTNLEYGVAKKRRAGAGNQGPVYAYYNVPKGIFDHLLNANSPGRAVWDKLRVRGSRSAHQFGYSLAAEGLMWNKARTQQIEYVPRKAEGKGFAPREFRGMDGRTVRNTLPMTAPARGTPNRGEP